MKSSSKINFLSSKTFQKKYFPQSASNHRRLRNVLNDGTGIKLQLNFSFGVSVSEPCSKYRRMIVIKVLQKKRIIYFISKSLLFSINSKKKAGYNFLGGSGPKCSDRIQTPVFFLYNSTQFPLKSRDKYGQKQVNPTQHQNFNLLLND